MFNALGDKNEPTLHVCLCVRVLVREANLNRRRIQRATIAAVTGEAGPVKAADTDFCPGAVAGAVQPCGHGGNGQSHSAPADTPIGIREVNLLTKGTAANPVTRPHQRLEQAMRLRAQNQEGGGHRQDTELSQQRFGKQQCPERKPQQNQEVNPSRAAQFTQRHTSVA